MTYCHKCKRKNEDLYLLYCEYCFREIHWPNFIDGKHMIIFSDSRDLPDEDNLDWSFVPSNFARHAYIICMYDVDQHRKILRPGVFKIEPKCYTATKLAGNYDSACMSDTWKKCLKDLKEELKANRFEAYWLACRMRDGV